MDGRKALSDEAWMVEGRAGLWKERRYLMRPGLWKNELVEEALFDDIKVTCLSLRANLLKNAKKNLGASIVSRAAVLYWFRFRVSYLLASRYAVSLQVSYFIFKSYRCNHYLL